MFGGQLARLWGPKRFLNLYLVSAVVAGAAQLTVAGLASSEPCPTVGASGGAFAFYLNVIGTQAGVDCNDAAAFFVPALWRLTADVTYVG